MKENVMLQKGLELALDALLAADWDGATVGLFINDVDPGKTGVVGSFDPATFATSTPQVITWGEKYRNANGDPEVSSQLIQFDWDSGAAETAFGILVKSAGAGTPLLQYAKLDAGKLMSTTNDSLSLVVRLTMSHTGFGASIQVSE